MKHLLSLFLLSAMLLGWSGCSTTPVAPAQKAGIKTIQLEPRIDCNQSMRYGADLSGGGGLSSVLAGMLVDGLGQKGVARMSALMQTNEIIVPDLVRSNVTVRVQQYPELQLTNANADGVLVVKILQYGFDSPGLKLSTRMPFVLLRAELLTREGKCIWGRQNDITDLTAAGLGGTWDAYEADPEKLRADWNAQVEHVVGCLFPLKTGGTSAAR